MKENEFPVLKVSNIDWDKDHEEYDKLPKDLQLQWGSKEWSIDEVSNWIMQKFDWIFDSINICLLYTSPSPRDLSTSRMPSSA